MRALLHLEMRRRWRSPGAWLYLLITLAVTGGVCAYKNLYQGTVGFDAAYRYVLLSLAVGAPILVWGAYSRDRKNDAEKFLFSRNVSPIALSFARLLSAWSVCLLGALLTMAAPLAVCVCAEKSAVTVFSSAAAYFGTACALTGFCLWLDACALSAWRGRLGAFIALLCVCFLTPGLELLLRGGVPLAILGFVAVWFLLTLLVTGSFRESVLLPAILGAAGFLSILLGREDLPVWAAERLALMDQMRRLIDGIFDASLLAICLLAGAMFACFAAAALIRRRNQVHAPLLRRRDVRMLAVPLAVFWLASALLPLAGASITAIDATRIGAIAPVEEAQAVLDESDEDIQVYFVSSKSDSWVEALLSRYEAMSSRFHAQRIDLIAQPDFTADYYGAEGEDGCLIVTGGGRYAVIPARNIYMYTYAYNSASQSYAPTDLFFAAQQQLLTAIRFVSAQDAPVVRALTGHGESTMGAYAREILYDSGIFLTGLDLARDGLDKSCDCLLIYAPLTDLTKAEKDAILTYLQGGGSLLLATNYQYGQLDNLFSVMDYCGMEPKGLLTIETQAGLFVQDYAYYPAPVASSHPASGTAAGTQVIVPTAHAIAASQTRREGLARMPLLTTSADSYIKVNNQVSTLDREDGDLDGPAVLAMAATDDEMRAVWVSGSGYLEDSVAMASSGTNLRFWLGEVQWAARSAGVSPLVELESPSLATARLTFTQPQKLIIILACALPALLALLFFLLRVRRSR